MTARATGGEPAPAGELARAEAEVEAHSASLKKELGVRDLALTQLLFIVGLTWIGVAGKLGPSHVVFWLLATLAASARGQRLLRSGVREICLGFGPRLCADLSSHGTRL